MASTAAGVAVGSSIGHGIAGMFGGYGGQPVEQAEQQAPATADYSPAPVRGCEGDAKAFGSCMTEFNGDMNACGWYLEQFRACTQRM